MTPHVRPFDGPPADWDAFARSASGWTHVHLYGWRAVMERTLGHECVYLGAYGADGSLRGILPLVRVRSRLFGHYLVSMPFLNYGGALGGDEAIGALTDAAVTRAEADGVTLLELRHRAAAPVRLPVSHRKVTVVLELPTGDIAPLWDGLPAKVRSQVRRPGKEGVEVRFGPDQLEPFYAVFAEHMRDLGTPVLGQPFFRGIRDTFPEDAWFGCAWLDGEPVAGGCGFQWGAEFEMTWASSLRRYNRVAPNMLLYWAFMERCVARGIAVFNFGRCTPDSGTHRFKRQWGSRDEPLHWYQRAAGDAGGTPSPDDAKFRLATRIWRRLPLAVANRLGPPIVRLIP